MSRAVVALAVLATVGSALSPRFHRLTAGDLAIAIAALALYPCLRKAPLPRLLRGAAAFWVVAAAVSGAAALLAHRPEQPVLVLLVVGRTAEVVLALFLGAAAGAAGGRDAVRGTLLVAAGAAGLYGLVERLMPLTALPGLAGERMARSFERGLFVAEANHFAGLFAVAGAVALPLASGAAQGALRRAAGFCLVLAVPGALATGSRTGLAALVIGMVVAAALHGRRALPPLVAAFVVAIALAPAALSARLGSLVTAFAPGARSSFAFRAHNWDVVRAGLAAHPFLGEGPGTRAMGYVDSEILLAITGGALGVLATTLWVSALWLALRGRERPGETGALVAVLVLGVSAVSLHLTRVALPFALVAGAALREGRHRHGSGTMGAAVRNS